MFQSDKPTRDTFATLAIRCRLALSVADWLLQSPIGSYRVRTYWVKASMFVILLWTVELDGSEMGSGCDWYVRESMSQMYVHQSVTNMFTRIFPLLFTPEFLLAVEMTN